MEEKHVFRLHSTWTGDSDSEGEVNAPDFCLPYSVPLPLGGKPGRTNPEELLTAAAVSCYCITLAIMAEGRKIPITEIEVDAEGEIIRQPDRRLKFTAIRLRPRLTVDGDEAQQKRALDAAMRAEQRCLISEAMRGNVEITVEPEIAPASQITV